jgi:hypothetical protein
MFATPTPSRVGGYIINVLLEIDSASHDNEDR